MLQLAETSTENNLITSEFMRTMAKFKVVKVYRCENLALHETFMEKRNEMKKEFDLGKFNETEHERWLFYLQLPDESIDRICKGSYPFMFRDGKDNKYGNGIYFSKEATFVDDQVAADKDGIKRLLLARVVVGRIDAGHSQLTPPIIKQQSGKGAKTIHSLADSEEEPITFVIPDGACAYPAYLIYYKLKSGLAEKQ